MDTVGASTDTAGDHLDPVSGPEVWTGERIQTDDSWVLHLTEEMKAEVDRLVETAEQRSLTIPFDRADLPLQA
ncbi:MAG: hypothetical protein ACR2QK_05060, partial [Acidimicrobiales bacterium]